MVRSLIAVGSKNKHRLIDYDVTLCPVPCAAVQVSKVESVVLLYSTIEPLEIRVIFPKFWGEIRNNNK